jgi:hypothetical protein
MEDPALAQRYAEKAAARALEFGAENAANRYWEVIRGEIGDAHPAGDLSADGAPT